MASSSNNAEFNTNNEGPGVTNNINAPNYNQQHYNITNQNGQPLKSYVKIVKKFLKNKKIVVPNVNGNPLRITPDMLKQTPIVERISYEQLEDPSAKDTNNRKRTTDIADILINEDDPNETIAIIGGSGSGKSVCASMILQFYIDQEKFPFLINMRDIVDDEILLKFVDFLQSYSSTNLSNPKVVVDLLHENPEDCVFIVDGLDQSQKKPFPFGKLQPERDGAMTAFSWLSSLFEKRKMENSKLIFTSKEASMSKLADSFKPRFQPYCLKGFTEEGMKLAIKVVDKDADVDQIYDFIHAKGGAFSNLATIPIILSFITSMYKTKKNELEASSTLTNLYSLTLEHVKSESKVERNKQMETKVNKLFYHMLTESRYSSTQNELQTYGLSLEDLENVTMVSVDKREGSRCDVKNVRITPTHQSVQEFSSAHFIAHTLDLTEFKELVDNKLFSYDLQEQWNMVRRFVSGILAAAQTDPLVEKKNYFMEAYIRNLKALLSTDFLTNVTGHKKRNLEELQSSLNLDLMEMPNETDSIKSSLTSLSCITIETRPRDVTMMEGTNFFISQLDPHIFRLSIYLPSNCDLRNFNRMTSSIGKLSKKIRMLDIENINLPFSHVDQIAQLIDNVGDYFYLGYTSETKVDEMMNIKSKMQSFVDSRPTLETHIKLNHNWRDYILRPQPDVTSLTPSNKLIKQSQLNKGCKEIDLRLLTSSRILQSIIGLDEWKRYAFDFTICLRMEIITFSKLMKQMEINRVGRISLCLPEDVENDDLELFCQTIARHEKQIIGIHIMNIVWSDLYFDQICKILPNVEFVQLDIIVEVSEDEKDRITTKFRPHVREFCRLGIAFLDDRRFIPDENHLG